MADQEDIRFYNAGEIIFHRGDVSGDLLVVEEGEVQIFTEKNGKEVILTKMVRGEVIGVTTYLTGEPRMASARALSSLKVKVISGVALRKALDKLPDWVKVVLKEFTQRLHKMNDAYSVAVSKGLGDKPRYLQAPSYVQVMSQLASFLFAMAQVLCDEMDETRGALPTELVETAADALGYEKEIVEQCYQVMLDVGMLRLTQDPEKKRKYIKQSELEKVKSFCSFVASTRLKKVRAVINSGLKAKDVKFLGGLFRYCEQMKVELHQPVRLDVATLQEDLEKQVGIAFEAESLQGARALEMLKVDNPKDIHKIEFIPAKLARILVHLDAYKRLQKLDETIQD
ncbi:MAG: cyclic nucleotide-binding domain-containing protein [Zetaproteobacteria bacterium]|nr:cyclic nucleotide-binding domain-containing protein [Zetaproteobacteria bacterium]